MTERPKLFVPLVVDYLIGIDKECTAHALPNDLGARLNGKPASTAVCGKKVQLGAVEFNDGQGARAFQWPPRVSHWKELNDAGRCRECWEKTGRRRPSADYDSVIGIRILTEQEVAS